MSVPRPGYGYASRQFLQLGLSAVTGLETLNLVSDDCLSLFTYAKVDGNLDSNYAQFAISTSSKN